jgi:hypothetical protein
MLLVSPLQSPLVSPLRSPLAGPGSASGYATTASDYDGTNDYATRGADLTGIADGKAGTLSLWARMDGGDGTNMILMANAVGVATSCVTIQRSAANRFQLSLRNAALTSIGSINSASTNFTAGATWRNVLCSWDLAAGVARMYVTDVSEGSVVPTNDTIDYTLGNFSIGAGTGGGTKFNGCLSEVFFHTQFIDLTLAANRRKFISGSGKPVFLGADGSLPLGVQPLLYAPNGNPTTNLGSGGAFTVTGSLDPCSSSPST